MKKWEKLVIYITLIVIVICFVILMLNNFSQKPTIDCKEFESDDYKYVSCIEDSDCVANSCGCLNNEGVKALSKWTKTCGVSLSCLPPESCSCIQRQCMASDSIQKNQLNVLTDKPKFEDEEITFQIINDFDHRVFYDDPCDGVFLVKWYNDTALKWQDVPTLSDKDCQISLTELAAGEKVRYTLDSERYVFDQPKDSSYRIIVHFTEKQDSNSPLNDTFFSSNNFKIILR